MGQSIERTTFTDEDRRRFRERLDESLGVLEELLSRPGFGRGEASIGAELELCIVDAAGRAAPLAERLRDALGDPRLTLEINRYDIEANLTPGPLAGRPFERLEAEIVAMLALLNDGAAADGARVVPVGILPTLRPRDLVADMITPDARYEALTRELRERRGEKFHIRLDGRESLSAKTDSVAPEGACTSFQLHYRAHPERFAESFNVVQLITPLLVGFAANSPFVLGRELWHESRIGLFAQAIDGRDAERRALELPARVHLGHGWLRRGPFEAFAETVRLYEPLLPIVDDESPRASLEAGELPGFSELDLQMGTVWPWNRAVYDARDAGHVRIELRAMPAGPTARDMSANAALAIGLAEGVARRVRGARDRAAARASPAEPRVRRAGRHRRPVALARRAQPHARGTPAGRHPRGAPPDGARRARRGGRDRRRGHPHARERRAPPRAAGERGGAGRSVRWSRWSVRGKARESVAADGSARSGRCSRATPSSRSPTSRSPTGRRPDAGGSDLDEAVRKLVRLAAGLVREVRPQHLAHVLDRARSKPRATSPRRTCSTNSATVTSHSASSTAAAMPSSTRISTWCSATETNTSTPVRPAVRCRFCRKNCSRA